MSTSEHDWEGVRGVDENNLECASSLDDIATVMGYKLALQENHSMLLENQEVSDGLLRDLYQEGVLTGEERRSLTWGVPYLSLWRIHYCEEDKMRNKLLEIMSSESESDVEKFVQVLKKHDQNDLAQAIKKTALSVTLMGYKKALQENHSMLLENLKVSDDLLWDLFEEGALTWEEHYTLCWIPSWQEDRRRNKLLQIMRSKSDGAIKKFVKVLEKVDQKDLAQAIQKTALSKTLLGLRTVSDSLLWDLYCKGVLYTEELHTLLANPSWEEATMRNGLLQIMGSKSAGHVEKFIDILEKHIQKDLAQAIQQMACQPGTTPHPHRSTQGKSDGTIKKFVKVLEKDDQKDMAQAKQKTALSKALTGLLDSCSVSGCLLWDLYCKGVLVTEELHTLRRNSSWEEANMRNTLLQIMRSKSDGRVEKFIKILEKHNQKDLAQAIKKTASQPDPTPHPRWSTQGKTTALQLNTFGVMDSDWSNTGAKGLSTNMNINQTLTGYKKALQENHSMLLEKLTVSGGLLCDLYREGVLTEEEWRTLAWNSNTLLQIMSSKSDGRVEKFIEILEKHNQKDLAQAIKKTASQPDPTPHPPQSTQGKTTALQLNTFGVMDSDWSNTGAKGICTNMNINQTLPGYKKALQENHPMLLESLTLSGGLLCDLYQEGVLTKEEWRTLAWNSNTLLQIMSSKLEHHVEKFVEILEKYDQKDLAQAIKKTASQSDPTPHPPQSTQGEASALQWRRSGNSSSYLLGSDALELIFQDQHLHPNYGLLSFLLGWQTFSRVVPTYTADSFQVAVKHSRGDEETAVDSASSLDDTANKIRSNLSFICDQVDAQRLLDQLLAKGIISKKELDEIQNDNQNKTQKLLMTLFRYKKLESWVQVFLNFVKEFNNHVYRLIMKTDTPLVKKSQRSLIEETLNNITSGNIKARNIHEIIRRNLPLLSREMESKLRNSTYNASSNLSNEDNHFIDSKTDDLGKIEAVMICLLGKDDNHWVYDFLQTARAIIGDSRLSTMFNIPRE